MNAEELQKLKDALEIGRDAAHEVAQRFHEEMKGYREAEHKQVDKDVADIEEAIAIAESTLAAPAAVGVLSDEQIIDICAKEFKDMYHETCDDWIVGFARRILAAAAPAYTEQELGQPYMFKLPGDYDWHVGFAPLPAGAFKVTELAINTAQQEPLVKASAVPEALQTGAKASYQQMTEKEKAEHDELVDKLDSMRIAKLDRDRRRNVVTIDFAERRITERRNSER